METYIPPIYLVDYDDVLGIDCDQAAGDVATFFIPFKCRVVNCQQQVTEVCAGTTSTPVVSWDKRVTLASDTDRGDADVAHFIMGTTAAGKVLYDKAGAGVTLEPGQEVVVQLVTAAVGTPTGHFRPMLVVQPIPHGIDDFDAAVETA